MKTYKIGNGNRHPTTRISFREIVTISSKISFGCKNRQTNKQKPPTTNLPAAISKVMILYLVLALLVRAYDSNPNKISLSLAAFPFLPSAKFLPALLSGFSWASEQKTARQNSIPGSVCFEV